MENERQVILDNDRHIKFTDLKKGMRFLLFEADGSIAHSDESNSRDDFGYHIAASDVRLENNIGIVEIEVFDA